MNSSYRVLKTVCRDSRLSLAQNTEAATTISRLLPMLRFETTALRTPGDRDKTTDLRESPPDFFTRDLHEIVLAGGADAAVHSAKDLEDIPPEGIDWFWLPRSADARDAIVMRAGLDYDNINGNCVAGVSSHRREEYCRRFFPGLRTACIRGTIDERLAKLDAGEYDMLIMAAAALQRLGLASRIARLIPFTELTPPAGQGHLALTFRRGDPRLELIRGLFTRPAVFTGAGCGTADNCTKAAIDALANCDACFHDRLLDPDLLDYLPAGARRVDVGKRGSHRSTDQTAINMDMANAVRRGLRAVRLKGGDPGIFGRLAEELESLDSLGLPYRIIPGVSSLAAATTGTGMLLTRRGVSRGFTVMTPREQGGGTASVQMDARARLPLVFFMAIEAIADVMRQLSKDGMPPETPVAVVFGAGSQDEITVRGTLGDIAGKIHDTGQPGIVVVGAPASRAYRDLRSPLSGTRVLLACTKTLSGKAGLAVRDLGGTPVFQRLLETVARPDAARIIRRINAYDYVVVTSPTSARILLEILDNCGLDLRALPRIIVTGTGTARVFRANGIRPDIIPVNDPGSRGVLDAAAAKVHHGARILRLRSDAAGSRIADELAAIGFNVTDCVIYENRIVTGNRPLPAFDAVFFASASAVEAFMVVAGREHLAGKLIAPMGQPTAEALNRHSIAVERLPGETTLESAMLLLAAMNIEKRLEEIPQ